ncbi:hypothetical protein C8J57DRAFT_1254822 [Mycena rebaudengoi]|nr:hypothetical protein C8J57DRAFT_1254822 [Mycena rebaudengoi]
MSPSHTTPKPKGSVVADPFDGLCSSDFMALVPYLVDLPKLRATKVDKLATIYRNCSDTIREWAARFDKTNPAPLIARTLFSNHDHLLRALGNHCHPAWVKINPPTLEGNERRTVQPLPSDWVMPPIETYSATKASRKRKEVESDSDDNDDPLILNLTRQISAAMTKPSEAKHIKTEPKEPHASVPKPDKVPKQPTKTAGSSAARPQPTPANASRNVATAKNPALRGQAPDEDVEEVSPTKVQGKQKAPARDRSITPLDPRTMGTTLFSPFGTNLRTGPTSLHSRQLVSYYPDLSKAAVNDLLEINPKVLNRLPPSCLNCILAFRKCDAASYGFQCVQCEELNKPGETCSFMRGEEELDIIRRDLFPEVTKGAFYVSLLTDELVHAYRQSLVATNMAISSTYAFEDRLCDFLVHLKEISDDLGVDGLKERFTRWPNSDTDISVALADWAIKSLAAYEDSRKARDIVRDRINYAGHTSSPVSASEAPSSPPPNIATLDEEPEATLEAKTSTIGVETVAEATGEV